MTKLGATLKFLFPKTVARLIELDRLQGNIYIKKVNLIHFGGGQDSMELPRAKAIAKELQTLRREFNAKKMWWMKSV